MSAIMHRRIAKITNVDLSIEDHGILTLYVHLDYGGSSQGFGGYRLDCFNKELNQSEGTAAGTDFIIRILELFNANRLKDLVGKVCYALMDADSFTAGIIGLAQIEPDGGKQFLVTDWRQRWFSNEV